MNSPLKRGLAALFLEVTGLLMRGTGTFCAFYLALKLHGGWSDLLFFIALAMAVSVGYPILVGFLHAFFRPPGNLKLAVDIFAIPLIWIAAGYYLYHSNYLIGPRVHYLLMVLGAVVTVFLFFDRLSRVGEHQPMRISWHN